MDAGVSAFLWANCVVINNAFDPSGAAGMVRLCHRKPRPTSAIHVVTNRRQGKGREYVTHLLRRSYREGGKVRNETVGNISHLPEELVELVRAGLRGEPVGMLSEAFSIERSLPAGHVLAALSMARRLELARLVDRPRAERHRIMNFAARTKNVRCFRGGTESWCPSILRIASIRHFWPCLIARIGLGR